ncbi:MAG: S9 family peptidase, partial [Flavobacterium sp.]|nr:S9 family peptidase [Flavobacterium sp.]
MSTLAQQNLTPETLWQLGRVTPLGISKDGKLLVYKVGTPSIEENKINSKYYTIPVQGGNTTLVEDYKSFLADKNVSPDGKLLLFSKEVKVEKLLGKDLYPELSKTTAQVYTGLDYRHWDTWNDGRFNHVFYKEVKEGGKIVDIMATEPFHSPQMPFGGDEDFMWTPDGKGIVYVCKKKFGTAYATSTNTDLYQYDLATGKTVNLTEGMMGYDVQPTFSPDGYLTWLSMARDGFESDKNDLVVRFNGQNINLTQNWDGTVADYRWDADGKKILFTAPLDGTVQLFEVDFPGMTKKLPVVKQLSEGDFDITGIIGQVGNMLFVSRTDMNHAAELFSFDLKNKTWKQITHVNDAEYDKIKLSKVERRYVSTSDGKKMLVWVVLPPDFDPAKKYPTLLYCQGGPQSQVSQFYSFRWNFQLMASQGYIV